MIIQTVHLYLSMLGRVPSVYTPPLDIIQLITITQNIALNGILEWPGNP